MKSNVMERPASTAEQAPDALLPLEVLPQPLPHESERTSLTDREGTASTSTTEPLGSLSLKEAVQIDWDAAEELGAPVQAWVGQRARRYATFTPAVASAISHHANPSTRVILPTAAQIKEQSFGLSLVSNVLEFFSPDWAARFDNYLEQRARQRIAVVAQRATRTIDTIGAIKAPKAQFLREVEDMYKYVQGDGGTKNRPEENLPQLAVDFSGLGPSGLAKEGRHDERDKYPLLGKLLSANNLYLYMGPDRKRVVRAVSPEVMQGVEQFLKKHGVEVATTQFASYRSLTRRVIQRLAPHRLSRLSHEIEKTLTQAYTVLPEDGRKFARSVYGLCSKVTHLAHGGLDGRTITDALLKNIWR